MVNRATITASPSRAAALCLDALAAVRARRYRGTGSGDAAQKKMKRGKAASKEEPHALRVEGSEVRRGVSKL